MKTLQFATATAVVLSLGTAAAGAQSAGRPQIPCGTEGQALGNENQSVASLRQNAPPMKSAAQPKTEAMLRWIFPNRAHHTIHHPTTAAAPYAGSRG